MTVTPELVRKRFDASGGTDPIFRTNDGSTSPLADVSTPVARRTAYALLLDRALIRVGMGIPAGAEFTLVGVTANDYDGYASSKELSLFRRPLPAANLKFLSTVMWDGRETLGCDPPSTPCVSANGQPTSFATLHFDLSDQANAATLGHAQGNKPGLTDAQREAIVAHAPDAASGDVATLIGEDGGERQKRATRGGRDHLSRSDEGSKACGSNSSSDHSASAPSRVTLMTRQPGANSWST